MQERECKRCGNIKDISFFPIEIVNGKEYIRYKCKICRGEERRNKNNYKELRRKSYNRYYSKNKEEILQRASEYKKTPKGIIAVLNSNTLRQRCLVKTNDGTVTINSTQELFNNQGGVCNYCGLDLVTHKKHLDHIKPLSKGGLHSIYNLQRLCATCNLKKMKQIWRLK